MTLLRTPLYTCHLAAHARMVDFGGWEMPVQYEGILAEHAAVRTRAGMFDVSHMGEAEITGPGALEAANRLLCNDLTRIADGQAMYSPMCRPDGGIVDDVIAYRFGRERIFICINAANRDKDIAWIREQVGNRATVTHRSDEFAQIAVQGPKAAAIVQAITTAPLGGIKNYHFTTGTAVNAPAIFARTGYTGEDGFEVYVPAAAGPALWNALLEAGKPHGMAPAGLGARDSLRTEARLVLYGNDISDDTNPLEAGLGWTVKLDGPDFTGKEALAAIKARGLKRRLVGFEVTGRGIARHGYPVKTPKGDGTVTSGLHSPTLNKPIGLAYVPEGAHEVGTAIEVIIRDKPVSAVIVKTPFYKRLAP